MDAPRALVLDNTFGTLRLIHYCYPHKSILSSRTIRAALMTRIVALQGLHTLEQWS